jgi:GNAT superfamily N-acetyltransferase
MKIDTRNNRIFFNDLDKAYGNISIENNIATIELIKVNQNFRGLNLAAKLLQYIISYVKKYFKNINKIELTPLPIDTNGLKIDQLISFYERYGFRRVYSSGTYNTYLMNQYIK